MVELLRSLFSSNTLTLSASLLSIVAAAVPYLITPLIRRKHKAEIKIKLDNKNIQLMYKDIAKLEDQLRQLIAEKEKLEQQLQEEVATLEESPRIESASSDLTLNQYIYESECADNDQ